MATQLTVKDVLQKAIGKEIEAQKLYSDLEKMMTNQAAKDTFHELVNQEKGHEKLLERYIRGELKVGVLRIEQVIDYKITENFGPTEIFINMPLKDIFLRAANREKAAHEAYLALGKAHPQGEIKKLLDELAAQELEHKHKLETLYTEVAFPQTAGG